jgi:hypothetical protein
MGVAVMPSALFRNDAASQDGQHQQQGQDQQFLDHTDLLSPSVNATGDSSEPGFGVMYAITRKKSHSGSGPGTCFNAVTFPDEGSS